MVPLDSNAVYQLTSSLKAGHHGKWLEMTNTGAGDVKGLRVRHRHHEHHYVESETRESFVLAAGDEKEAQDWVAAIEKALANSKEDYTDAIAAAQAPPPPSAVTPGSEVHEWMKLKLATHAMASLRPHEVEAAAKWMAGKLQEEPGQEYHRGDADTAAEEAMCHISPEVFDALPSGNEQSKAALQHWMFALQPADIAEVRAALEGLLKGEEAGMSDDDADRVLGADVEALLAKVFAGNAEAA
jgi:DNA-binding ferritin-like protein (Dps family)